MTSLPLPARLRDHRDQRHLRLIGDERRERHLPALPLDNCAQPHGVRSSNDHHVSMFWHADIRTAVLNRGYPGLTPTAPSPVAANEFEQR